MPPPSAIVDDPAEVATERYARHGLGNAQTYNKNKLRFRALLPKAQVRCVSSGCRGVRDGSETRQLWRAHT
jgi:hypothetical protein